MTPLSQPPKPPSRTLRFVERYRGAQRLARGRRTGPRPLPGQFVREEQPAPLEVRGACPRERCVGGGAVAIEESGDGPRVIDRSLVHRSAGCHGWIVDPSAENAAITGQQGSRQDNATRQREVFDIVKTRWSRFKDRPEAIEHDRSAAFGKVQVRLLRRGPEERPPCLGLAQTRRGIG